MVHRAEALMPCKPTKWARPRLCPDRLARPDQPLMRRRRFVRQRLCSKRRRQIRINPDMLAAKMGCSNLVLMQRNRLRLHWHPVEVLELTALAHPCIRISRKRCSRNKTAFSRLTQQAIRIRRRSAHQARPMHRCTQTPRLLTTTASATALT